MEKPITSKLQKLLASTTRVLETFEATDDPATLLNTLMTEYRAVEAQAKEYGDTDKKMILNQIKFSLNCLNGLAEAYKRKQSDLPVKTHLDNIRLGLVKVINEVQRGSKPVVEKMAENLKGADWMATLKNIRKQMVDVPDVAQSVPDTTLNATDVSIVQNLGSKPVDLLLDEPYGMITAPVLVSQGRFDRAAKVMLATEDITLQELLETYYAIENAPVLGVSAETHTPSFVNDALRFVNEHNKNKLDLCGPCQRVNAHFYYLLMPKKAVQNRNVSINQWTFQKKL
jgi:hypothetical protein